MKEWLNHFTELNFRFLYYISLFFIFIGETVKKIFFIFFKFFFKFIFGLFSLSYFLFFRLILKLKLFLLLFLEKILKELIKKIYYFFKNLKFKKEKKSYTPIKVSKIYKKSSSVYFSFKQRLFYFSLGAFLTLTVLFFYNSYLFIKNLPSPTSIGKVNYRLSTHIYDRNGKILYEIFRNENRTPVSLKELPKDLINATIAIEDKDFYSHKGINITGGILRAVKENFLNNKKIQGGSTITQQLVKSALLSPERTIKRKLKEIILALWTERIYTKDQILEMYLNQVAYGGSSYGIEEASKTYFGKSAKYLTLNEAAFLAGLPQAPSLYSPYVNPEASFRRKNEVLEAMYKQGYISKKKFEDLKRQKLDILPPRNNILAPHFVFYVKSNLEDFFGTKIVEEGGLKVITTLDLNIQKEAEKILKEELEKVSYLNISNGAILVTRPATGEILAMVGSVDYFLEPWGAYNVTTALRQPGSSIKPLLYALALEKQYTPATIIDDVPTVFRIPGSEPYRPVNYDGRFHGRVPFRYALANSYNIPAVKIIEKIGVENFINYSKNLGISTFINKNRYGLSLALGGGEVKMTDMAEAFGVFANLGYRVSLNYYLKIEDSNGNLLREINPVKTKKIDPGIAFIISDILSDNQARLWAFGPNSALEIPGHKVAVKTGTTDNKKDNWTIGYTPDFLVAVWVGNNDGSPMNPYLTSGITGAAPIWNRMMSYLLKNYSRENKWYKKPDNLVEKICFFGRKEYFIKGTENDNNCILPLFFNPTPNPKRD